MLTGLQHLHSALRYVLLLVLIATILNAYLKSKKNEPFVSRDNNFSLGTFILAHTQLLLGLALYFLGNKGASYLGMEDFMKNSMMRFFAVEHVFGMLIAIGLITFGRIKSKKLTNDMAKHKTTFIYFLIALFIIIASIPWPFRGFGQAWF